MLHHYPPQGIARTRTFFELGWSRHEITRALAAGTLVRAARGWIATSETDRDLMRIATVGLPITCVSAAARLGLWKLHDEQTHFAVPYKSKPLHRLPQHTRLHWGSPIVARTADGLIDPLENALQFIASCCRFEDAVAIWDSAIKRELVYRDALLRLPFTGAAAKVLEATSPFADSGLESYVRLRLRWLKIRVLPQAWVLGHRVDFLLGDRLILQIDGATHTGKQRDADNRFDAQALLHGYTTIRVGYAQVMHHWHDVQELIMQAIAQGKHRASH